MPETSDPDINVYDMRLVRHEDGWIYGLFCTEAATPTPRGDLSSAVAQCGIVPHPRLEDVAAAGRSGDGIAAAAQRGAAPEFVDGKYAFYTRPQDGFIEAGSAAASAGPWPTASNTR